MITILEHLIIYVNNAIVRANVTMFLKCIFAYTCCTEIKHSFRTLMPVLNCLHVRLLVLSLERLEMLVHQYSRHFNIKTLSYRYRNPHL